MYAAHFAAALAVKARVPEAPAWALLTAAFVPDLAWIALARLGIEPELPPKGFFDDWSHSLLMILVLASIFALAFWRHRWRVVVAVWVAGLSHFFLDFLIHPAKLAIYPFSSVRLGWSLWQFGQQKSCLGPNHYWWIETGVIVPLLVVYLWSWRRGFLQQRLMAASCFVVIGLHLLSL